MMERPAWVKDKTVSDTFEVVEGTFDEYKDWSLDPKGYFLIRVNREQRRVEVAHCTNNHVMTKMIYAEGNNIAQKIYVTAIKLNLISNLVHAAYLGKELKKAEYALLNNAEYEQE